MVIRTLKYLKTAPNYELVFKKGESGAIKPVIFSDASHGTHTDGKGHGALMVSLGSASIYFRSYKLKLTTLSSTESEHVALCEAATMAAWLKSAMVSLGLGEHVIKVYQDNTSTIWMTANEGNFARNKHILIRRNFVKEQIVDGTITVHYRPITSLPADMGTKPKARKPLERDVLLYGMIPL
jgi:hypothetical protein